MGTLLKRFGSRFFVFATLTFIQFQAWAKPNSFHDLNGVMWFYTSSQDIRFTAITAQLDSLKKRGINIVGIYSPYHGHKAKWLGCAPIDFYNVSPQSGTLDDWAALVKSAHSKGMKIVTYFANIYLDKESPYFLKAVQQYKSGDRTSREVNTFRWTIDPRSPLPPSDAIIPVPGEENGEEWKSQWKFNPTAGAYYWSIWGEAGFDFSHSGAKAEVERIMKFWLDSGVDGFMFDAGLANKNLHPYMVELPQKYTANDKWLTFESTSAEESSTFDNFGLTSWFNFEDNDLDNDYSMLVRGKSNVHQLEQALQAADQVRAKGKMTHAWSLWQETGNEEEYPPYKTADFCKNFFEAKDMKIHVTFRI